MSHEQQERQKQQSASLLRRFGIAWNGPLEPLTTPMADGYWTPWHLAQAAIEGLQGENERLTKQANENALAALHEGEIAKEAEAQLAAKDAEISRLRDNREAWALLATQAQESLTTLRGAVAQIEQEMRRRVEHANYIPGASYNLVLKWADALSAITHPPEHETGPR